MDVCIFHLFPYIFLNIAFNFSAICFVYIFFLQKRNRWLYQDTAISSVSITDVWEPIEEGLVPLSLTIFADHILSEYFAITLMYVRILKILKFYIQSGDDTACFNDFNLSISQRIKQKLPRVAYLFLLFWSLWYLLITSSPFLYFLGIKFPWSSQGVSPGISSLNSNSSLK